MAKDNLPKLPPLEEVLGAVTGESGISKDIGNYLVEAIRNLSDAERKELAKALNLAENKSYVKEPVVIDKHCAKGDCDIQFSSIEGNRTVICKYLRYGDCRYGVSEDFLYVVCNFSSTWR